MTRFERPILSRYVSDAVPAFPRKRQIDVSAPKSDLEKAAERYIVSRADFILMKSETYMREYYLDIGDLQRAIGDRERYLQEVEGIKRLAGSVPVGSLRAAIDSLVDEGYQSLEEGAAAEDVLMFLDSRPEEMICALNRMLQRWAYAPGDEQYDDYVPPEFVIRNAERFARAIGTLDLSADSGRLVQLSGTLLYLSDPVEIEFTRMAFLCQQCSEYTVTEGEKPESCDHCGSRKLKFDMNSELTTTRNFQEAILQENVEDLAGSAASVRMRFFGQLLNRFTAGDRITVCGIVKSISVPKSSVRVYMIDVLSASRSDDRMVAISEKDRETIMEMSRAPHVLDRLASILAPEIIGREAEKKAMILQAVGGIEKKRSSVTERGRIHILFAGDPGMGKSQLLLSQRILSEKSYYISDSSKAGITAAVAEVGNRRVMVPGILVLANNGVACIDELDKMQKEDREGLHTSMEQGIISKSKAGLRATFQASTSILAAANPVYGRFDLSSDIPGQLKIEPTLMDRFDLVFWFVSGEPGSQEKQVAEALNILNPPKAEDASILAKYVKLASQNIPGHTPDSLQAIAMAWYALKQKSSNPESVGVRHLQAIRRISEASAKIRFAAEVERTDVDLAFSLMMRSMSPLGGDADRILGFGRQTTDAMKFITSYLKERHEASMAEMESWAMSEGIQSQDLRNAISTLKREGQIFEPRNGKFRVVA